MISMQVLQERGFGLTKDLVGKVIHDYLKDQPARSNPFQNGIPGQDWWRLFLKQWQSQLSMRKPQHLPTSRASAATPEAIRAWFDRVDNFLQMALEDLQHHLWNCDKTGFWHAGTFLPGEETGMFRKQ